MGIDPSLIVLATEVLFLLLSLAAAYGMIKYQIKHLNKDVEDIKDALRDKADKDDHERVERHLERHVEDGQKVITDIAEIKTDVRNMNKKLDRMNGKH